MNRIASILMSLWLCLLMTATARAQGGSGDVGMPFYCNFSAEEYNAHNRNFDILCLGDGHVVVANFEGLLLHNGASWRMVHTPAISRITRLYKDVKGNVWFGGYNLVGKLNILAGDSIDVDYVVSDKSGMRFGEVTQFAELGGYVFFATSTDNIYKVGNKRVEPFVPSPKSHLYAKLHEERITHLPVIAPAGLCSTNINALSDDGHGSLWGATDNGLFRISTSQTYTHFGKEDGLDGQVTTIIQSGGNLYVGTLMGLYKRVGNSFERISTIHQACWQLVETPHKTVLAATPEGVFEISGESIHQLSPRHTLSLLIDGNDAFLAGELEGIYRHTYGGSNAKLDDADNVVTLERDDRGGVWAMTLYGMTRYKAPTSNKFIDRKNEDLSQLLHYRDTRGHLWYNTGKAGLHMSSSDTEQMARMDPWLMPFRESGVRCAYEKDGVLWLGGPFGIIRFDYAACEMVKVQSPRVFIRKQHLEGRSLTVSFSTDTEAPLGTTLFSYRLKRDDKWSEWSKEREMSFPNLAYGPYILELRAMDAYGNVVKASPYFFNVPYPVYFRWYFLLLYLAMVVGLVYVFFLWRMRRMVNERLRLEGIVAERTMSLRSTLTQLEDAQGELLRQEREATVGKLTKGLIDRILNPMNYINNFSHLSLGLTKDLKENLEDDREHMTDDIYEDSQDVIGMMQQNLQKIEEHGMSTTRILKSMEEMLRDRSGATTPTDLSALVQQAYEMLQNYYAKDIETLKIQTLWERPAEPVLVDIIGEHTSKALMSVVANSVYAIRQRCERNEEGYEPQISFTLAKTEASATLTVRDNGIGIEDTIIDKIFDPFFTTKPTAMASGVGLYLCQQIVQDYGGTVAVKSEKYNYTELTMTFPIRKKE